MKYFTLALLSSFWLASCSGGVSNDLRPVEVDGYFSIQLPKNLEPSAQLHDFASLQYGSDKAGFYVVGLQESKEDISGIHLKYTVEDYIHFVEQTLKGRLDTSFSDPPMLFSQNGLNAAEMDMKGMIFGGEEPVEIAYKIAVFESPSHFYQLTLWTDYEKRDKFSEVTNKIVCSFRELPGAAAKAATESVEGEGAESQPL